MSLNIIKIIWLAIFLSTIAYAQDDQITVFGSTNQLSLGIQEDLWGSVKQKGLMGYGSNKEFLAGQLGFEVVSGEFIGNAFIGPYLGSDWHLGTVADIGFGIRDRNLNYIGLMYRQMGSSNDIIGAEIKFSLSR